MREGTRNFIVGVTSATALLGLSGLMMRFGELDAWLNPKYTVMLLTDEAAGLRPGGTIEFSGVPIGVIDRVSIEPDPNHPVHVRLLINEAIDVPENVQPFSVTPLIGGSARLQLQAPESEVGQPVAMFAKDGTAHIDGPIRGGLLDAITKQLDARMEPIIRALDSFNALSATYSEVGQHLNDLLITQSPEEVAAGAPPNIKTAVIKLNAALDDIHAALGLAKDWLGDEQMRTDARGAVEKARILIENATAAVDKYTKLAESLETNSQQLAQKLLPVADQLAATLEEVNRLTLAANKGEGTVGQLMTNPDLYNSLNDAAVRLERTLVEIQLLIEKFKKEGVPINW